MLVGFVGARIPLLYAVDRTDPAGLAVTGRCRIQLRLGVVEGGILLYGKYRDKRSGEMSYVVDFNRVLRKV